MLLKRGDVIIFSYGFELKAVKVLTLAKQRVSALAALNLYEDLSDTCLLNINYKLTS